MRHLSRPVSSLLLDAVAVAAVVVIDKRLCVIYFGLL